MWLERKLNDSCSERGKQVFYEVYYDLKVHENNNQRMLGPTKSFLAITWHVQQQKTTITNKYPLSKKRKKKKWRCWEHFSIKVSYVSWYRRWQGMVISHFLPHWQEMYMHIFSENGDIIRGLGLNTVKERNWCRIPLLNQVSFTRIWTSDWLYNYTCIYMYMYTLQIHWNNRYIIILYMCTSDNMNKLI